MTNLIVSLEGHIPTNDNPLRNGWGLRDGGCDRGRRNHRIDPNLDASFGIYVDAAEVI